MKRLFLAAALLLALSSAAFAQTMHETAQERAVTVDPALLALGVHATVGSLPPDESQNKKAPFAIVFMTYEKAFHGELTLRGFNKDGREIGRSERVTAWEQAESAGHQRFAFDKDTRLGDVQSFKLEGKSTPIPPKEESMGEKAEKIVKELLE